MPRSSRPGIGRSRAAVAPPASTVASKPRELRHRDVDADVGVHAKLGAFGAHLVEPAVEVPLLHLELGDAVPQQPADAVGALEHHDIVTGARELLRRGEARRARSDDGDALAGPNRRHDRLDPAFGPRAIDDLDLYLLDRDGILVDAEHARRLARRGTQPAGELGKVVRRVQALDRLAPVIAVDEVVPVGDQVAERAAVVAERDAAIHAAAGLLLERVALERLVHLVPIVQAHATRRAAWV